MTKFARHALLLMGILFATLSSRADVAEKNTSIPFEPYRIWLGIPAAGYVGFGVGDAVQGRYIADSGWVYTVVDSVAVVWGLSSNLGDCAPRDSSCENRRNQNTYAALAVFAVSRVVQLVDASIWSYNYYQKSQAALFLAPTKSGFVLQTSLSF